MIVRAGGGWQTILADLALILFMVSISGVRDGAADVSSPRHEPAVMRAEPAAIYRSAESGPSLGQWLAGQAGDPRQRLTIIARHVEGGGEAASRAALALAAEAGAAGQAARIIIEPGVADDLFAVLAFDTPDGGWHDICSGPGRDGNRPPVQKEVRCE